MKDKDAKAGTAATGEKASCCSCCGGDSCPMMKDGEHASHAGMTMKHEGMKDSPSCSCCGHTDKKAG